MTMTVNPYTNLPLQQPPPPSLVKAQPSLAPTVSLPAAALPSQSNANGQEGTHAPPPAATPGGLALQDHPNLTPVYNGVNPSYPNLRVLHQNPPIFAIPNFLTPTECDFLISISQDCLASAPVVGMGAGELTPSRTSSTCYLAREDLPEYLNKVSILTGKPVSHCELPQVGRYFPAQQYMQHFDAFDLSNEDGRRFASNGGQRTVTVLTYLNDVEEGGHTAFPALNLEVKPQKGMAIVFFPATVDGLLDQNALHAAKPAVDTKYVSQVWIRQGDYDGVPSKRIFSSVEQASIVQKSLICAREGNAGNGNVNGVVGQTATRTCDT
jgi:prolyl 4-hydroxylase